MASYCRVWHMHQARCTLCDWSGEVVADSASAAYDARVHRRSPEHKNRVAAQIHWRSSD